MFLCFTMKKIWDLKYSVWLWCVWLSTSPPPSVFISLRRLLLRQFKPFYKYRKTFIVNDRGFFLGKKGYLRCVFGISFLIYLALYMICQFEPFAVSRKAWGPKWVEFHYTFVSVENSFSVLHRLVVPLLLFGICSIVNQITWCGWKK